MSSRPILDLHEQGGQRLSEHMRRYLEIILYQSYAELKAEAARGYLGILWWIMEPLLYLAVFYFCFTTFRGRHEKGFVEFLLIGLIIWKWFAATIPHGARAIISGKSLMRQVYLPKFIFPAVAVVTNLLKFLMLFPFLLIYLLIAGISPTTSWLVLPLLIMIQFALLMGICSFLASIIPFLPDLNQIINNSLMILFFLSGVIIDIDKIPERFRIFYYINPMAVLISDYRQVLISGEIPSWAGLLFVTAVALVFWGAATAIMRRFDRIYPKVFM